MITTTSKSVPPGKLNNYVNGVALIGEGKVIIPQLSRITIKNIKWAKFSKSTQKKLLNMGWLPVPTMVKGEVHYNSVLFITE